MTARRLGAALLGVLVAALAAAPVLSPNDPSRQFAGHAYAPPMRPRIVADGQLRRPFVYPVVVEDRLERRFREDRGRPATLSFFAGGRLVSASPDPWLPLGGDPLGRDVLSRLLAGGRLSLGDRPDGATGARFLQQVKQLLESPLLLLL